MVTMIGAGTGVLLATALAALIAGFSSDDPLTGPLWPDGTPSVSAAPAADRSSVTAEPSTGPTPTPSPQPTAPVGTAPTSSAPDPASTDHPGNGNKPTKSPGKPR